MSTPPHRMLCLAALLAAFLAAAGCAPPQKVLAPGPPPPSAVPAGELPAQADQAWQQGDTERAEELYRQLLERGELAPPAQVTAWQRLALAAVDNGHPEQALAALDNWAALDPGATEAWAFHLAMFKALILKQEDGSAEAHLTRLLLDTDRPWELREQAATYLSDRFWQREHFGPALQIQHELYAQTPENATRRLLEEEILLRLEQLSGDQLQQAAEAVVQERQWSYPYALVAWETALRKLRQDPGAWAQVWPMLNRVVHQSSLLTRPRLKAALIALEKEYGRPSQGLALVLPLSGRYAPVAWKILAGANTAQWQLVQSGSPLELTVVNSDGPDWLTRLSSLPATVNIVGGPLQASTWEEILGSEAGRRRAFFTFRPSLDQGLEGTRGWRFFPSPRDQAATLAEAAASELNATRVAVLYPQDQFGRGMSEIFWKEAVSRGMSVTGLESYPPGEPTRWLDSVRQLLQVAGDEEEDLFRPDPDFRAVFIPDTLSSAQLMVPNFFYLDEDRLFIMGPELWNQALSQGQELEQNYFRLAITPGAWWPDNPSPGTRSLTEELEAMALGQPDFWTALGYDFVRFAAGFGPLPWDWNAKTVNALLSQPANLDWAMAPLTWDHSGRARQHLFLFQPHRSGVRLASPPVLRERAREIALRHEVRREARLAEHNATVDPGAPPRTNPFLSTEEPKP
ncbi:MAG: ABC transporter substrate-binding protein [Desulfohalobiaceae bacterium]